MGRWLQRARLFRCTAGDMTAAARVALTTREQARDQDHSTEQVLRRVTCSLDTAHNLCTRMCAKGRAHDGDPHLSRQQWPR